MVNFKENEQLNTLNHSCAHVMAQAIKHLYPNAKFWVGPVVAEGFYYDIDLGDDVIRDEDIEKITQEMRKYFEYIIIDTSAGINGSVFDIVTNSDLILIVTTPDPVCVRDARMMSDEFYKRGNQKQRLVINKANKRIFEFDEMDDLDAIIDTVGVQLLGVIPEDSAIPLATGKGAPLSSSSMGFLAFSAISRRIKGEHIPLSIKV